MGRARLAVSTLFFVDGAVLASWLPHIPGVKARLTAGDGQLGLVLLAMAGGAVVALPTAGSLIDRLGSRVVSSAAAVALSMAVPLPVLSSTLPALIVALAVLGACNALLDVSMNTQAAVVEQRIGRPIMSSFHALFRLGGMTTGYLGFLAGPPLIGAVAELAGLSLGLALVCVACAFVAIRGGSLPEA
jgi:MFS family permease